MTLVSAFLCRLGGHKPYEIPRVVWQPRDQRTGLQDGQMMMVKRCKRCGAELGRRPMEADEDVIEA
jgi:hypothetical protein